MTLPATCPTSVARTKQTARKVTGGHAPRVNLAVLQKKKAKAKAASNKPSPKIPANKNSFCVMCRDGGEMWICDEEASKRGWCQVHVCDLPLPWQKTKKDPKPYFGFYSMGKPALSTPPLIPGGFQHTMTSQVAPLPIALLHLYLDGLHQDIGHPQVAMFHSFIQAYFLEGGYHFSQLPFNLATPESMEGYDKKASHLANTSVLIQGWSFSLLPTLMRTEEISLLATSTRNQWLLKHLRWGKYDILCMWIFGHQSPEFQWGERDCPTSPTSKASWTTQPSKDFLLPVQQRLL
ncbi:hypothetical protein EDC04DRAFT_3025806 [Pisolithus marmoratus]|nr:hypothetical protein EDC04DRAFT_3025806 [Pisolithus marmoratus]